MTSLEDAVTALRSGRSPAEMLETFAQLAAGSRRADHHHWHGVVLRDVGRTDEAIAAFRRAASIDPRQPGTQYYLATTLMDRAVLDEALAAYRETVRLLAPAPSQRPFLASVHGELGFALMMHGEQEAAIQAFRQGLSMRPDPAAHAQLVYYLQYLPSADAAALL
ncbi:MAG: hypothetical protein ACRENE_18695, partial [Polyangiaceae bacterium]